MRTLKHHKTKVDIATTFGVDRGTVYEWCKKADFPRETRYGWHREKVTKWVDTHRKEQDALIGLDGDKDRKLALECTRLEVSILRERERLKHEKIETQERLGRVHGVKECQQEWSRAGATLRGTVDSWQTHQTAKYPDRRELIDDLAETFLEVLLGATGAA